jgi:hypothetical protein
LAQYGKRKEAMLIDPEEDAEEVHRRIREAIGVPESSTTGFQEERMGIMVEYALSDVWPGEKEWYEGQGIQVRTEEELSGERRSREEAEHAELVRVVKKWGAAAGDQRIKRGPPQEPPQPPARDTVEVEMRYGDNRRRARMVSNTSADGMMQLLVSGFGDNVRKQWREITPNLSLREMEEYGPDKGWSC